MPRTHLIAEQFSPAIAAAQRARKLLHNAEALYRGLAAAALPLELTNTSLEFTWDSRTVVFCVQAHGRRIRTTHENGWRDENGSRKLCAIVTFHLESLEPRFERDQPLFAVVLDENGNMRLSDSPSFSLHLQDADAFVSVALHLIEAIHANLPVLTLSAPT